MILTRTPHNVRAIYRSPRGMQGTQYSGPDSAATEIAVDMDPLGVVWSVGLSMPMIIILMVRHVF